MVASKNIKEHPYSVSSQLIKIKTATSKDIIRSKPSAAPRKQIFPDEKGAFNPLMPRAGKENIGQQGAAKYDYQAYLDKPSTFIIDLQPINKY